jgi:hypothetical protein
LMTAQSWNCELAVTASMHHLIEHHLAPYDETCLPIHHQPLG